MLRAIELSAGNLKDLHGGPFGALVVQGERVLGQGSNQVLARNDPTAHAEIVAIRQACTILDSYDLSDCLIYSSCEPCPMCLGAIYWARIKGIYYACTRDDAAEIGFDDRFFYQELIKPAGLRQIKSEQALRAQGLEVFERWKLLEDRPLY